MPRILRTPESRSDVVEIVLYIRRDSRRAAKRLLDTFNEKLELLARFPGLGQRRDELAPGIRSLPVGEYLIFYRPLSDGIVVIRVLHGKRDLRRLFRRK